MDTHELCAHLRTTGGGSPSEIAERFGLRRDSKVFREAIALVCWEGWFKAEGGTSSRRYIRLAPLRTSRLCPTCSSRVFGDPTWTCSVHGVAVDQINRPYYLKPDWPDGKPGVAPLGFVGIRRDEAFAKMSQGRMTFGTGKES